jgi:hypothetical protein
MKNYLEKKDRYNKAFADAIMDKFRSLRYGVSPCHDSGDFDHISMRKDLLDWQLQGDLALYSDIKRDYCRWLPAEDHDVEDNQLTVITINIVENAAKAFKVETASQIWTFTHDLLFNPNVTTTDPNGNEILGVLKYLDDKTVEITFNKPVMGWAYLS